MSDLQGKNFRALRRLSTKDNLTLAEVGETCERVPVSSLGWLLSSRKIEPVPESAPASDAVSADEAPRKPKRATR